jgi:hypothetical protein
MWKLVKPYSKPTVFLVTVKAEKGGIGPNLTDNFWINQPEKTLFKNVFYMVENGSKNNPTMQAWGKNGVVNGFEMQAVAAYVYHINQEQAPITPAQGGAAPQELRHTGKNLINTYKEIVKGYRSI